MSRIFPKRKPKLRERQEVLQAYTQICGFIGDREFKIMSLKKEVQGFLNQVDALSREMDLILIKERQDQPKAETKTADENPS